MPCFMQDGDEGWPPVKTERSCFRSGARQVNLVPLIKLHTNSGIGRVLIATVWVGRGAGRGGASKFHRIFQLFDVLVCVLIFCNLSGKKLIC
jgi:hypothetical protein